MNTFHLVVTVLKYAIIFLTLHKWVYVVIGFLAKKRTFCVTESLHRYAIVICARNEEKVIGKLLESIRKQDYPSELLDTFVVCDNCTDKTEEISRAHGAKVIVRSCPEKQRKGYALEYAFNIIERDKYDAFFIFDADNLLAPDYVTQMNRAFDAGNRVVTSYRSVKNFDTNIISSGYGFHFLSNNMVYHRARSVLGLGTHLTGTGYMFDAKLIGKDGWHYVNLTEDDEFPADLTAKGIKIAFCEDAVFYDEQPTDVGTAFRQRVRWARGRFVMFFRNAGRLFKAIFTMKSFTGYDIFWHYFPFGLTTWFLGVIYPAVTVIASLAGGASADYASMLGNVLGAAAAVALYGWLYSVLAAIRERDKIKTKKGLLIFYIICSPWFLLSDTFNFIVAVFWDTKWTRIEHKDDRGIENVNR